jgi:hypothetical protein
MPSLMAILGLDASGFERGLDRAKKTASSAGQKIGLSFRDMVASKVGVLAAGFTAGALLDSVLETTRRIHELSKEFRVSTDEVQRWDKASKRVNMTAEDMGSAFDRLKKAREEAIASGNVGAFGIFGLGMEELKNTAITTEQVMEKMSGVLVAHPITDREDVAGMELMGKSGARILSAMQELKNLGPVHLIQHEDIERIQEYDRAIHRYMSDVKQAAVPLVARVLEGQSYIQLLLSNMFKSGPIKGFNKALEEIAARADEIKGKASNVTDGANTYRFTKTVDLNKDAAQIDKLRSELAERIFQNNLASMGVEERRLALKKQISEHERKAQEFEFGEGDDVKALEERLKAEQIRGELGKSKADFGHPQMDVNNLQRIGAFASLPGGDTALRDASTRSEKHLQRIVTLLEKPNTPAGKVQY